MTIYQYCDRKFQNLSIELQTNFSIAKEAQTKSLLFILSAQRFFYKWISVPRFLFCYFLTAIGIFELPPDRLAEFKEQKKQDLEVQKAAKGVQEGGNPDAEVLPK